MDLPTQYTLFWDLQVSKNGVRHDPFLARAMMEELLDDLEFESFVATLPASEIFELVKRVLLLARKYFQIEKNILMSPDKNPELIVGETQNDAHDKTVIGVVESRRIKFKRTILHNPEKVVPVLDFLYDRLDRLQRNAPLSEDEVVFPRRIDKEAYDSILHKVDNFIDQYVEVGFVSDLLPHKLGKTQLARRNGSRILRKHSAKHYYWLRKKSKQDKRRSSTKSKKKDLNIHINH